jgi:hypothetical protein
MHLISLVSIGLVRSAATYSACIPVFPLAYCTGPSRGALFTPTLAKLGASARRAAWSHPRAMCSAAEGAEEAQSSKGTGAPLLHVLFQDEHLAVVSKPGGMLMHRSRDAGRETVFFLQTVRDQLGKHVFFVNRIDRATSGMVVLAFDGPTAALLQTALASPEASKECKRRPPNDKGFAWKVGGFRVCVARYCLQGNCQ